MFLYALLLALFYHLEFLAFFQQSYLIVHCHSFDYCDLLFILEILNSLSCLSYRLLESCNLVGSFKRLRFYFLKQVFLVFFIDVYRVAHSLHRKENSGFVLCHVLIARAERFEFKFLFEFLIVVSESSEFFLQERTF